MVYAAEAYCRIRFSSCQKTMRKTSKNMSPNNNSKKIVNNLSPYLLELFDDDLLTIDFELDNK
ncbi:MAG: hypothetical protein M3270_00595 [Thermoproteota archaeon]|nr:hypothetical protein [Thermoproteota archaeon]